MEYTKEIAEETAEKTQKELLRKLAERKRILACCAAVAWMVLISFLVHPLVFEGNDDTGLASYLYGLRGYGYESHLVYINVFFGQCLCTLLRLFPSIPWYTVAQCGLVILSFFVIVYLLLERFGVRKALLSAAMLFVFFGSEFLLNLQYTKTAGIAVLAGILLLFDAVKPDAQGRKWKTVLAAFLTIAGSMMRFKVFEMLLIPLLGIGLSMVWAPLKDRKWKEVLRICLPFIVVFTVCLGFRVYNNRVYQQDPQWSAYIEFNSLRTELLDYGFPAYEENRELYESLNISESDLAMYKKWDIADPDIFTTEALRQLVAAKTPKTHTLKDGTDFAKRLISYVYSPAFLIAGLIALFTCSKKRRFLLCYEFAALLGVEIYLFCKGRYGLNRIDASILLAGVLILTLYCWGDRKPIGRTATAVLGCLLVISPFVKGPVQTAAQSISGTEPFPVYELIASDPEHLYVHTVYSGLPLIPRPLEMYPVSYRANLLSLGGWGTNIPPHLDTMAHYGVTNAFRDIVDNPDMYMICAEEQIDSRLAYIQAHYAPEAAAYCVKIIDGTYHAYRISTNGPVLDTENAVPGEDILYGSISASLTEGGVEVSGQLYAEETNSFASNIYIGVTGESGEEVLFYMTQTLEPGRDHMNGGYGVFSGSLPDCQENDTVRLYLETGDALYYVDAGILGQIITDQGEKASDLTA